MKSDQPSSTALLIGRSLLIADATEDLRALLAEGSAAWTRRFLDAAGPAPLFEIVLRSAWLRRWALRLERLVLPGIVAHYLVRKRWIEQLARESIAAGCEQLVVLGAGLDTLGVRLAHLPVFELDHPATQRIKRRVCEDALTLIEAELWSQSPAERLQAQPNFNPRLPTLFVAEGLLMYFQPERVKQLMAELSGFAAAGSRFIFTFMEERAGRPLAFHNGRAAIDWWLQFRREPFLWGLARNQMASFLSEAGWQLSAMSTPEELRKLYPTGQLAIGETLVLASFPT